METTEDRIKIDLRKEVLIWLALAVPLVLGLWLWNVLPDQMPVHWSVSGEPDGFASKFWAVIGLVLLNLGVYLLLLFVPKLDPRKNNNTYFNGPYYMLRLGVAALTAVIHAGGILAAHEGGEYPIPKVVIPAIFLMLMVLGNYMTTIRSNYFIGIRTPWTLESEEVWKQTHRLAGKIWFWAGLLGMLASFFIPAEKAIYLLIGVVAVIAIIPMVYSYLLYQKTGRVRKAE